MDKVVRRQESSTSQLSPSKGAQVHGVSKAEPPPLPAPDRSSFRDESIYMTYEHKNASSEKGYSVHDGSSFAHHARGAVLDLGLDEPASKQKKATIWDRKKKKFVGQGEGADNVKLIRTENGTRLPATYRSGRFEEWTRKTNLRLPRTGEEELGHGDVEPNKGRAYKHNKVTEAKRPDPKLLGYERKVRLLRKKEGKGEVPLSASVRKAKSELKSAELIRKERKLAERKRSKSGGPKKKRGATRR
ncbi:ATP-dependent RNA helicase dbp10 [Tulasnella sp. 427]|nr:ATP-dependent RNA helicase dbp10 [Tulasnella sp. 427]